MPGLLAGLNFGRALVDHHRVLDVGALPSGGQPPRFADLPARAQSRRVAAVQPAVLAQQQFPVDRLRTHPHGRILRVGLGQPAADLGRGPAPVELALHHHPQPLLRH
jgi:hypothetical protein